jgi:uncharacterized protein (TIGR02271 family)
MPTRNRSAVVAAFADEARAQQAMDDLQQAGFAPEQIRYSERRSGTQITNSLENLGIPEQEATFYNREFEAGRTVVMVNTVDRQQEAYDILRRRGGYDFGSRAPQMDGYNSSSQASQVDGYNFDSRASQVDGYNSGSQTSQVDGYNSTIDTEEEEEKRRSLKLHEEQLRVQKRPVERGEARLRKDVVSEQKDIDVPVMHEEVYFERRPGSGQPADQPIGKGETYRIPVREEQMNVEKQPVVREEVSLGKRPVRENKRVSDTIRHEQAHIEHAGDIDVQGIDWDTLSD